MLVRRDWWGVLLALLLWDTMLVVVVLAVCVVAVVACAVGAVWC